MLEVIDVIVGVALRNRRKVLIDTRTPMALFVHAASRLTEAYGETREALLPLLKDPEPQVRKAVLTRFVTVTPTVVLT